MRCSRHVGVVDQGLSVRSGQLALLSQGEAVRLRGAASTLQPARLPGKTPTRILVDDCNVYWLDQDAGSVMKVGK